MGDQKSKEELYAIPEPSPPELTQEPSWQDLDPEPRTGISAEAIKTLTDQLEAAGPSEIPNRNKMEALFQRSFGGVKVYTGISTLDVLGTDAAAGKGELMFAGGMPDERTLAHELVHILQYESGGEPGGELSQGGDGAEQEAVLLARRAALGLGEFVNPTAAPSAKVSRNSGGGGGGGGAPPSSPVQVSGGDVNSGGATWRFENQGGWKARRDRTFQDGDLDESQDAFEREVKVHIAGQEWKIETPADWAVVADQLGDAEVDNIAAQYEVGGVHANALAEYAITTEKVEVKAGAAANITLASGKLVLQTDMVSMSVLNETIKGKAGVELEASAVAEVSGEVGLEAGVGDDGPEAGLSSEAKAFAGGKAGIRGFLVMQWQPQGAGDKDIAGASVGVEGWVGAAAAAKLEIKLFPVLEASGYYAAALGWGAGVKAEIKIHLVDAALLSLTLAGRGAARALEGIGLDSVAAAIDKLLNELWLDDAARGVANDPTALSALSVDQCKGLVNKMLDGATLNEDEQAILKVLAHADSQGGLRTLVYGVEGGYYRLLDSFDGDEYDQLLEYLYVSGSVDDVPINDDVARSLIDKGLHANMSRFRVERLIHELLDGYTGDADEDALLKVCRDRVDVLTPGLIDDILDNLHGSQDAAMRGFLWLEGKLSGVDVDDDCARAIITHDMHTGVSDLSKLNVLLDAMISGATGNDDEACIVKLLLDIPTYASQLDDARLEAALDNVDGEEYEDLLVALRRANRITFLRGGIDFDDNVARLAVNNDLHKGVLSTDENQRAIRELLSGFTGDADEQAIVSILKENMSAIRQILPVPLAEEVKSNTHGAEYDELLAIFVTANYMESGITIDDDLVRAMVRLGLHTHSANRGRLLEFINALLDGATLDGDEQAILAIIRDCESVRAEIDDPLLGRIADKVDGQEYTDLVVLLRQTGRINLASPPVTISLDDDIARAVVDTIGVAALSNDERKRMIQELNNGFTGDADEARILTIVRESDVLAQMEQGDIDTTLSNVHGEERNELFVLVARKARSKFQLPNEYFDDNCARHFVDQSLHIDGTVALTDQDCRHLVIAMLDGWTGNDDEQRILKLIRERESVLDALSSTEIDRLHGDLHGDEQEDFFVFLAKKGKLDWSNLHADFDDNTARRFVDERLHVEHGADTARRKALIEKMLTGFAGDDDEDRVLTILDADSAILPAYEDAKLKEILAAFDGEQNTALWLRVARAGKVDLSWPEYRQLGFDDDVARAIIDENLHGEFSGEDLKKMLDEMNNGWVGDADEQRSLSILRDHWSKVESHLDQQFILRLCENFHGEEYERLLAILFIHEKLPQQYLQPPHLDDRTARGLILEGAHRNASVEYNVRIYKALIDGATTNGDEQNLLTLIKDVPALLDHPEVTLEELYSNFHGVEESKLLVLLLDLGKLELDDERIDDDAICEFVKQGKHTDQRISPENLNHLVLRLIDGATGADDETAILEILRARESQIGTILAGITFATLDSNVGGDNGHELAQFLYEKNHDREAIVEAMTTSRAIWFVDHDVPAQMTNPHLQKLVDTLIAGFEGNRLTVLLRAQSAKIPEIVSDVRLLNTNLMGEQRGEAMALVFQNGSAEQKDEVLEVLMPETGERFVRQRLFESMTGEQMNKLVTALLRFGDANGNRNAVQVVRFASEQGQSSIDAIVGDDQEAFLAQFNDTYRPDVETLIGGGGGAQQASGGGAQAPRFPLPAQG